MGKRYCKNVNILDGAFICKSIFQCLSDKKNREETLEFCQQFMPSLTEVTNEDLYNILHPASRIIQARLLNKELNLEPIKYFTQYDRNAKKFRHIGKESIVQQIFDYIAVNGIEEAFNKRIGTYQCACIPKRGQVYGKKALERWVQDSKYCLKMDISKCYESIPHDQLMKLLRKTIKNDMLLWLIETLIEHNGKGLLIGSYLSQYLCNYYLSFAYHYASEQLYTYRKNKRKNLISHVIMYVDDIAFLGNNKRYLHKAFEQFKKWLNSTLQLTIKENWSLFKIKGKNINGNYIDMMGFRIAKHKTLIRAGIFLTINHLMIKMKRLYKKQKMFDLKEAHALASLYGWLKHTNTYHYYLKYYKSFRMMLYAMKKGGKCSYVWTERKHKQALVFCN